MIRHAKTLFKRGRKLLPGGYVSGRVAPKPSAAPSLPPRTDAGTGARDSLDWLRSQNTPSASNIEAPHPLRSDWRLR
jgi:hypothetical protein